jgi:hypothetical protein
LLTDPTGKYVYTDPEDRRPANPCASIRDQQNRFLCEYHRLQQAKGASGARNDEHNNYECIGNPGAVEVRIPLAGGGEAPACLNAPQTEFERAYAGRQRKPKQLGIIEIIEQTCGIRLAATENSDEEENEDEASLQSTSSQPIWPSSPSQGKPSKRKLGDLQPLHQPGQNPTVEERLRKLSDQELLDSVVNPSKKDFITVRPGENVVINGNTRLYEMQRRMRQNPAGIFNKDLEIPVFEVPKAPLDPNLPPGY